MSGLLMVDEMLPSIFWNVQHFPRRARSILQPLHQATANLDSLEFQNIASMKVVDGHLLQA